MAEKRTCLQVARGCRKGLQQIYLVGIHARACAVFLEDTPALVVL